MSDDSNKNNEFEQWSAKYNSKKKKIPLWVWAILIIIGLAIIKESIHFANSSKNGWSPEHTKDIYESLNEGVSNITTDSSSRKILVNCVIKKLKYKYPEGLDSVNNDSLKTLIPVFISECTVQTNISLGWSHITDEAIRNQLMKLPSIKNLTTENQKIYCNCYIKNLKQRYPKGLKENLRESTNDSISVECSKELKK